MDIFSPTIRSAAGILLTMVTVADVRCTLNDKHDGDNTFKSSVLIGYTVTHWFLTIRMEHKREKWWKLKPPAPHHSAFSRSNGGNYI